MILRILEENHQPGSQGRRYTSYRIIFIELDIVFVRVTKNLFSIRNLFQVISESIPVYIWLVV